MPKALYLVLALCLAGGLIQNRSRIQHWIDPPLPRAPGADSVVLYATEWCGYCAKTRRFFRDNAIAYAEKDIEKSAESLAEYQKLGGHGVPVVVVNHATVIHGYDPDAIREALGF